MKRRLKIARVEVTYEAFDDEPVKLCHQCGECWPATDEFFMRHSNTGKLKSPCKACVAEKRYETNAADTCCVPGCDQPRRRTKGGKANYPRCGPHMVEYWQARHELRKVLMANKPCAVTECGQPRKRSHNGEVVYTRCEAHQREYWARWRRERDAVLKNQ